MAANGGNDHVDYINLFKMISVQAIIGFIGGIVNGVNQKELTAMQRFIAGFTGGACAAFITPLFFHILGLKPAENIYMLCFFAFMNGVMGKKTMDYASYWINKRFGKGDEKTPD